MRNFYCDSNLKQYVCSMLFDSDHDTIAQMKAKGLDGNQYTISLEVRGEVKVFYKETAYKRPSEFPEELKALIAAEPIMWDCHDDVYADMNNWFEYIITKKDSVTGEETSEGFVCGKDISKMTEADMKKELSAFISWYSSEQKDDKAS